MSINVIFWSLLIVPLIGLNYLALHQGDESRKYLPELRSLADHIALYPDFKRVGDERIALKRKGASIARSYETNARFDEIRRFYDSALAMDNWGPPDVPPPSIIVGEAPIVTYRRGDHEITIECSKELRRSCEIAFSLDLE